MSRPHPVDLLLFALPLLLAALLIGRVIAVGAAFGWDESVYALRARAWAEPGAPLSGWSYIRPPLLPLLGVLPYLAGGEEWQFRLLGLLAGLGLVGVGTAMAWQLGGRVGGLAAGLALATSTVVQRESASFLTDVPATSLLLAATWLTWRQLELRRRGGRLLVAGAALIGLAIFVRYGSVAAVVPLGVVSLALWWRPLLRGWRWTLAAIGVLVLATLGLLLHSLAQTGSPFQILDVARGAVTPDPRGVSPLSEYRHLFPEHLGGRVSGALMLIGFEFAPILRLAEALLQRRFTLRARATLFLGAVAVGHVLLLTRGVAHAEPRYYLYSTALMVVAGGALVGELARRARRRWGRRLDPVALPVAAVLSLGLLAVVAAAGWSDHRLARNATISRGNGFDGVVARAASALGRVAGRSCGVITRVEPQVTWYSGCATTHFGRPGPEVGGRQRMLHTGEKYLLVFDRGGTLQLSGQILDAYLATADRQPTMELRDPATGALLAAAWRVHDR